LKRSCPICGTNVGELLHHIDFAKGENEFIPSMYSIVSCYGCGFVFNDTNWNQLDYNKYYSATSKYTGLDTVGAGGISEKEILRYNRQIDRFRKYIPSFDSSIADIGCAKGGLLKTLQKAGYVNLYGVDASQECLSFLNTFGIKSIQAYLNDLDKVNVKFDLVILSHVLEHVYDLQSILKSIAGILKNDGMIYVEVPNAKIYGELLFGPFYYFDFEHINHFSEEYLESLFSKHFKCVLSSSSSEYNECFCLLQKYKHNNTVRNDSHHSDEYHNKILNYILNSLKTNCLIYQYISCLNYSGNVFFWGAGAYLRAQLEKGIFIPIKTNIRGLIDKNKSLWGQSVHCDFMEMDICIFSPDVIENCSCEDAVFITSVLYQVEIYNELKTRAFKGKIYNLCGNEYIEMSI